MYNFPRFRRKDFDFDKISGPQVGERLPDFEVSTLSGARLRMSSLLGRPLVLETGSITCGLYCGRIDGMCALMRDFPDLRFVVLYVREAHPGRRIAAHATLADKLTQARALPAVESEQRTLLVDQLDGAGHLALGGFPNMLWLVDAHGIIVHRGDWNHLDATRTVLQRFTDGVLDRPVESPFNRVPWRVEARVFRRAGFDALWDFLRQLPFLLWAQWRRERSKR